MFLSKALNKTERRWSTYEKEGYAIFYSLMKMEHLLRDTHFLLRTDHKNLTFINTDLREKVKRWKLAIQHYDFHIEHIEGEKNIEADGFSRIITIPDEEGLDKETMYVLREDAKPPALPRKVYESIRRVHNSDIGHGGVERTIAKLKISKQKWTGMRRDVKQFIQQCPCCQKLSTIKPIINTRPFTLASYSPFDRICVDTIGPLPTDENTQNEYILVIVDAFSRFVKLQAIRDTSAEAALPALLDWVGLFGIPSEVVSDNGTQFANSLVAEFLDTLETKDTKIQAYSKEENGIVERANKEVNRHLRTIVYNRKVKKQWSTYLALVQRIMNASVHSSIGVSPAQIVFGNSVRLDRNLLPIDIEAQDTTYRKHLNDLMQAQKDILEIAIRNQIENDQFNIANRGGKDITEFDINSYVLVNYEGEDHRPPSKLHTHLRGPLRIVNRSGPIYTLQNLVTNKLEDFHVKLLHPFEFDAAMVDPSEVAQHDEDYFEIVDVQQHRFQSNYHRQSDLEFLVLFKGEQEPVWQPWSIDIGKNDKIHTYLQDNNMRKYIPRQYTYPIDHPLYEKPVRRKRVQIDQPIRRRRRRRSSY
jgi:hypothetical protein